MEGVQWTSARRLAGVRGHRRPTKLVWKSSTSAWRPSSQVAAFPAVIVGLELVPRAEPARFGIRDRGKASLEPATTVTARAEPKPSREPAANHEAHAQSSSPRNWPEPSSRSLSALRRQSRSSAASGSSGEKSWPSLVERSSSEFTLFRKELMETLRSGRVVGRFKQSTSGRPNGVLRDADARRRRSTETTEATPAKRATSHRSRTSHRSDEARRLRDDTN